MSKGLKRLNDSGRMDIPEILFNIPGTIVDWDIYDDATSPDGGAWRKKTAHTSWYNEPLNTATRGSTREFPARALVTAEAAKVTIWDITSGQPEMWMVFIGNFTPIVTRNILVARGLDPVSSVRMIDNILVIGTAATSATTSLVLVDFVKDEGRAYNRLYGNEIYNSTISDRNAGSGSSTGSTLTKIVGDTVNSVAITYLDDAPLDAYGMRVPTIAVGTNGGVSVIKDDGSVVNITEGAGPNSIHRVGFSSDKRVAFMSSDSVGQSGYGHFYLTPIPLSDLTVAGGYYYQLPLPTENNSLAFTLNGIAINIDVNNAVNTINDIALAGNSTSLIGWNTGVAILVSNPTTPSSGMVAYLTNTYNTGWMVGDIRRAYLCNSLTADRSVNGGTLTITGTVTETVNAGGVNVYSWFNAVNYLSEASHADWNALGTGDFCFSMWVLGGAAQQTFIFSIGDASNGDIIALYHPNTFVFTPRIGNISVGSTIGFNGTMQYVVMARKNGILTLHVDSILALSTPNTTNVNAPLASLKIGTNYTNTWSGTQTSLFRISATAPTPEQIKHMYETERKMFETGAQALLSSSPSVTDLRYDKATDLYAVTNGTNTDVFKDLTRIDSAATGSKLNAPITTMSGNTLIAPAENIASSIRAIGVKQPKTVLLDFNVVVNGKFSTTSGWTLGAGWSIAGGQLVATAAAANSLVMQTPGLIPGQTYFAKSTATITSGSVFLPSDGAAVSSVIHLGGTQSYTFTATNNGLYAAIAPSIFTGTIDNVLVRLSTQSLPQGFKPKKVWAGGLLQEEGTDYDVTFDGFLYGVNFFIEPATNVQVEGEYI